MQSTSTPLLFGLLLGSGALGCATTTTDSQPTQPPTDAATDRARPAIDLETPEVTETATFALG